MKSVCVGGGEGGGVIFEVLTGAKIIDVLLLNSQKKLSSCNKSIDILHKLVITSGYQDPFACMACDSF